MLLLHQDISQLCSALLPHPLEIQRQFASILRRHFGSYVVSRQDFKVCPPSGEARGSAHPHDRMVMRGKGEGGEPRPWRNLDLLLRPEGPEVPPSLQAISAAATLRVEGEAVWAALGADVARAFPFRGRTVELDRNGIFARWREHPFTRARRPRAETARVYRGGPEAMDLSERIEAVAPPGLSGQPRVLSCPSEPTRCHLCMTNQVSGFAAILHKRVRGALPPPHVKRRSAFPLDMLPPAFATWQGLGRAQPCTKRKRQCMIGNHI